jgi:hypothetical protein
VIDHRHRFINTRPFLLRRDPEIDPLLLLVAASKPNGPSPALRPTDPLIIVDMSRLHQSPQTAPPLIPHLVAAPAPKLPTPTNHLLQRRKRKGDEKLEETGRGNEGELEREKEEIKC